MVVWGNKFCCQPLALSHHKPGLCSKCSVVRRLSTRSVRNSWHTLWADGGRKYICVGNITATSKKDAWRKGCVAFSESQCEREPSPLLALSECLAFSNFLSITRNHCWLQNGKTLQEILHVSEIESNNIHFLPPLHHDGQSFIQTLNCHSKTWDLLKCQIFQNAWNSRSLQLSNNNKKTFMKHRALSLMEVAFYCLVIACCGYSFVTPSK